MKSVCYSPHRVLNVRLRRRKHFNRLLYLLTGAKYTSRVYTCLLEPKYIYDMSLQGHLKHFKLKLPAGFNMFFNF